MRATSVEAEGLQGEDSKLVSWTAVDPLGNLAQTRTYRHGGYYANGDVRWVDTNGDGVVDANDRVVLGKPIPDFIYGLTFNGLAGNDRLQIINPPGDVFQPINRPIEFHGGVGSEVAGAATGAKSLLSGAN